jgi:serine/threonine-protein kinase
MLPAPRARRGTGTVALTHPAPTPAAPVIARNVSVRPAAPSSTPAMPAATATTAAASPSLRQISAALRDRAAEPASQADVADLLLGKAKRPPKPMLGRYEIDRELGKGAMGTVYLARDPRINRVVALKAIPLAEEFEEKNLAEVKARFFREAELAGRLKHPSIVTVHDAGEDGGLAYIAMEFVQGQVLSQFTASERLLPAAQVLEIGAQIADALDYAHRHDIVHRDIKPGNILFNRDTGETHITDFGIARLTDSTATRTGVVLGTPSFMSPEQLEGRTVKGPSDLFSLGVTLFQLLSGQLPFRADSMTGLMDKIANTPHPPLRTIRPDLAPCVSLIVDRALAKDPANRFQAGAEMSKALRACARQLAAS